MNMSHEIYAEVAVPLPLSASYTYRVPPHFIETLEQGMRVEVRFSNRVLAGVVLELHERPPAAEALDILDVLDDEPCLPTGALKLYKWISEYYFAPPGEVLQCALPPGYLDARQVYVRLGENGRKVLEGIPTGIDAAWKTQARRKYLDKLALLNGGEKSLSSWLKEPGGIDRDTLKQWRESGLIITREKEAGRGVEARTVTAYSCAEDWSEKAAQQLKRAPVQKLLLEKIAEAGCISRSELLELYPSSAGSLAALQKSGLISAVEMRVCRSPLGHQLVQESCARKPIISLNDEQTSAVERLAIALNSGEFKAALLEGVTGSGKTEVYLSAAESCTAAGRGVIFLVPEIAMTPQLLSRVHARFGNSVAVMHSGLSRGERLDEWQRVRSGEARVLVGARSAILAPMDNVGLIVVDEEHDPSYKGEDRVLYHARDVALMRGKIENALVLLGSATPSLESRFNAESGLYQRLTLTRRATDAAVPQIKLVDLKEFWMAQKRRLSSELIIAMRQRLERGEQSILFLNRRSYAPSLMCRKCRRVIECDDCSVPLAYHKHGEELVCHACGRSAALPRECPYCGRDELEMIGVGTQKIEEELELTFPKAVIERLDQDAVQKKGNMRDILQRMARNEIDILVGTQMVTKGHDFPNVTLVGVLLADQGLNFPDFRSAERTFQLLTQVAGRAGRHDKPGQVIIQTLRPDHHAIQCALDADFNRFFAEELQHREGMYPPYMRLAAVRLEGEDAQETFRLAGDIAEKLKHIIKEHKLESTQALGPAIAPIRRLRSNYRFRLLLRSASRKNLHVMLRAAQALKLWQSTDKVKVTLDVDPVNML